MKKPQATEVALNVLGEPLAPCSMDPMTGFYRDGCCNTGYEDTGIHTVCTRVTAKFLEFSKRRGNDLSTPMPEYGFPGLKPGDQWCLCAPRWQEALEAGMAPKVVLEATHAATLAHCKLADLQVLDKNPLSDIKNTTTIRFVMRDGHLYDANTLDEVWPKQKKLGYTWWTDGKW